MGMEKIEYLGFPNCLRLTNGDAEVVVSTDVGPRVLRYALAGSRNILAELPEINQQTALGSWKPYGGHRLWVAPEGMPGSYAPDNSPIGHQPLGELGVRLIQPADAAGFQKQISVTLDPEGSGVTLRHRVTNAGHYPVEVAPWSISVVRGEVALIPQEPFRAHGEALLPARPLVLWPFTDLSDPRFTLGPKFIRLKADPARAHPQKIGAGCTLGWAACVSQEAEGDRLLFVKRFDHHSGARYPDFGSNVESYVAGDYMELESLGPLGILAPGESVEHEERWFLQGGATLPGSDDELEATLAPLLARAR